jgi:hypothetical protein
MLKVVARPGAFLQVPEIDGRGAYRPRRRQPKQESGTSHAGGPYRGTLLTMSVTLRKSVSLPGGRRFS